MIWYEELVRVRDSLVEGRGYTLNETAALLADYLEFLQDMIVGPNDELLVIYLQERVNTFMFPDKTIPLMEWLSTFLQAVERESRDAPASPAEIIDAAAQTIDSMRGLRKLMGDRWTMAVKKFASFLKAVRLAMGEPGGPEEIPKEELRKPDTGSGRWSGPEL